MTKVKKTKIGILGSPKLSPNMVGELLNLGNMLNKHYELHLLTNSLYIPEYLKTYFIIHHTTTYFFDFANLRYARRNCKKFIDQETPALCMNIAQPQSLGWAVAKKCNKTNVISLIRMTGNSFYEATIYKSRLRKIKAWLLFNYIAKQAYKKANYIIAVGEELKGSLIKKDINSEKIYVLPQPFNKTNFSPTSFVKKQKIKKSIGLNSDKKTLLFVGRLSWLKGADRLLKIIKDVSRRSNKFQLLLVGNGDYKERFNKFPKELVFMAGNISRQDIYKYYQASDLLIFPSRTEGLPNVILEALAAKLPIIASPVGDIPNWVTKLATYPKEYVDYILSEDWNLDYFPKQFEYENLKDKYLKLFEEIINSSK